MTIIDVEWNYYDTLDNVFIFSHEGDLVARVPSIYASFVSRNVFLEKKNLFFQKLTQLSKNNPIRRQIIGEPPDYMGKSKEFRYTNYIQKLLDFKEEKENVLLYIGISTDITYTEPRSARSKTSNYNGNYVFPEITKRIFNSHDKAVSDPVYLLDIRASQIHLVVAPKLALPPNKNDIKPFLEKIENSLIKIHDPFFNRKRPENYIEIKETPDLEKILGRKY